MSEPQTAIFLSPHFDDIALSCGGMAARLAKMEARCIGLTVFAAPSSEGEELSPFAEELHAKWESAAGQGMAAINEVRREEERQALRLLGLQPVWLDFGDAPYRRGSTKEHLYTSDEGLFGKVAPEEQSVLVPRIASEIRRVADEAGARGRVRIFAPLAVGRHVDHQLVFRAARQLGPRYGVLYYEDYPYVTWPGAHISRLRSLGVFPPKTQDLPSNRVKDPTLALERREGSTIQNHTPRVVDVSDLIGVKIAAIARYKSQLGVLFGGGEAMPEAVRAYSQLVAAGVAGAEYAEWFWQLSSVWSVT